MAPAVSPSPTSGPLHGTASGQSPPETAAVTPLLSVVVPLYNEADSLRQLVAQLLEALRPMGLPFELVLVDDGSRDRTPSLLRELALEVPELVAVLLRRNYGQTAAMAAGFDSGRGPVIVTLDGDLQNDPADIPLLLATLEEGYDLAVRIARLQPSSLVSRQLSSTRLVLCASPEYLRRHGTPGHPSDLAEHAVIAYTLLSTGDHWAFEGPEGPAGVTVTPQMRTNSGDTCCAAALQHRGLVLQPTFLVGPHLASGALVEVMPQYRSIELGVFAVYPSRKHLTPKVRVLIDFLVGAFRTRAWPV